MDKMAIGQRPAKEQAGEETIQKSQRGSDNDSQSTSKKRKTEGEEEELVLSPEVLAGMTRSERKRHRERKRRSDVNKGFDDLMTLLIEIDPVVRAEADERAKKGQWKGNLGAQEENLLSRVELIGRSVEVLRRIYQENEQRKLIIDQLLKERQVAAVPSALNLPAPVSLARQAMTATTQQNFTGLDSLPVLRTSQAATSVPSTLVAPMLQQRIGGSALLGDFSPVGLMALRNVQMQTFPRILAAPVSFAQGPAPASLLQQLQAQRDQATAQLARSMTTRRPQPEP